MYHPRKFSVGQQIVCIDAEESRHFMYLIGPLEYMKVYTVKEYEAPFVVLQETKGEWHESRFVEWKGKL